MTRVFTWEGRQNSEVLLRSGGYGRSSVLNEHIQSQRCTWGKGEAEVSCDENIIFQSLPESLRDDAVKGQHLYMDFIGHEIQCRLMQQELEGIDMDILKCDEDDEDYWEHAGNEIGIHTQGPDVRRKQEWKRTGRELRQLADAFSKSNERKLLRKKAQEMRFESLGMRNFFHLLNGLFEGSEVNLERVLVLFFFCSDVAIEALRRGFHGAFHNILVWSMSYMKTRLSELVHSIGGWGVILKQSLGVACQFTACCAFIAVTAACVAYIRENLRVQ